MELVIVTGLSGAGKSRAVDALEDIGFYCVDNMPPFLMGKFVEVCVESNGTGGRLSRVAIVTDARGGDMFLELSTALSHLRERGILYKMLFLDAEDEVLVRRYKETRRKHPLASDTEGSVSAAVVRERELLKKVRAQADYIIDTSRITIQQLKERITMLFLGDSALGLTVHCMSFGFKYGGANEADLVFDVRCLPNPFYIDELRPQVGLDKPVRDYVMASEQTQGFAARLLDMIDYLLPLYCNEGKSQLVVAVGCTGGKHRSVVLTELLREHITALHYRTTVNHRDITK